MIAARLDRPADLACWRDAARALVAARVPPEEVAREPGLLAADPLPEAIAPPELRVPRAFVELAGIVLRHRDPERHALLYRALWRITHGERALLDDATDALVLRLEGLQRAVARDAHKMHAFVRFRAAATPEGDAHHIAWYEPEHLILEAEAPFFVRRFAQLRWSILTPDGSAHWDRQELRFGPPGERGQMPPADAGEELWRAYYASIFNPARLKPAAMRQNMPKKFWRNLPEAQDIPRLVQEAPARVEAMVARGFSEPAPVRQSRMYLMPRHLTSGPRVEETMPDDLFTRSDDPADALAALRAELEGDAYRDTNLVFGEGRPGSALMFVGEQPGDEEDRQKRPFVGPAGKLFNRALEEVGIPREEAYVTNAVKRFRYQMQGGRRIHQTPDAGDIKHYRPFLLREVGLVKPRLLVTLGATALKALTGKPLAVTKVRGEVMEGPDGRPLFPTVHPSYLLRLPDEDSKRREWGRFLEDLKRVHREVM
ncbi:MAG: UdgX family uracil-DNA binding protein [Acetobacteraceae bacterium]|nr:UdgX family uracil-DNA binding protein [Acetobacteraceae bacterium]